MSSSWMTRAPPRLHRWNTVRESEMRTQCQILREVVQMSDDEVQSTTYSKDPVIVALVTGVMVKLQADGAETAMSFIKGG